MSNGPDLVETRITSQDLAEIRRKWVVRRRWFMASGVMALLAVSPLAWKVNRHLFAAGWLQANSIRVDWQVDRETWRQGGVTTVKAVNNSFSFVERRGGDELASLPSLHRVEWLDLSQLVELQDTDLECLSDLADLQTLNLDQTNVQFLSRPDRKGITDATLARLRGLRRLRELSLVRTRITDAGLAHLSGLAELESLNLSQTRITDAGLEPLKGLKRLKWLTMNGTRLTVPAIRAFEAARPDVVVTAEDLAP